MSLFSLCSFVVSSQKATHVPEDLVEYNSVSNFIHVISYRYVA